ncbi:hypothetical protein LPJ61_000108 [Coemansia biformis]|uniref:F-box domain-containing protein n=1 Tax=Coemansia biformis TaxID=1286918 RepID=A0A9W8CYI8_9FUNG|nr:hypothetical protein LPJ61_000108 [Coemansia biformis]
MEPPDTEDEQCTCAAFASFGEHTPTCMLYTPLSALDIPEWQRRSSSSSSRPPSYPAHGVGIAGSGGGGFSASHYPPPSTVSSVAASYASTSSVLDSMAATETESLASYPLKRSVSVCSLSSVASSGHLLPTELFREVFMYLERDDLVSVVLVCRQWQSAVSPLLWRTLEFPLDKRRLAAMKPLLSRVGRHVRRVIVAPPLEVRRGDRGPSRRVSASGPRGWPLSRPLSRSGSSSSHHPHAQPDHRRRSETAAEFASVSASPMAREPASTPSTLSSPLHRPGTGVVPPPSPMLLSSPRQPSALSAATPAADSSASATPSFGAGQRQSPLLPPVYAVPIPGTPGPGNVISDSLSHSASGGSWGAPGLGGANIAGLPASSRAGNAPGHLHHLHQEISEGTVLRMHQFMERYCTHVLEAVVKNPAGISNHGRRLGILARLFRAYPRLERLDLSDFIMWDTQPLQLAAEQLRMLCSLDVTNRVELGDGDLLPVLQNCCRLRELRIRATNATDATIYAVISNLSDTLVSLNVGGCQVSPAAMSELVTACRRLRILQTWSCLRLDDSFLLALDARILTQLQVLDMMDVRRFSAAAIRKTFGQQAWPQMKYLRISAPCTREDFSGIPPQAVLKLNASTILD